MLTPFVSMDEMLSLSFAELQLSLAAPRPTSARTGLASVGSWLSRQDSARELDVFLVGPGARQAARTAEAAAVGGVLALSTRDALALVSDRQDFGSLEPIAELAARRERLVVTATAGKATLAGAQASSAASLARWFRQRRPDQTGRETFELQTEEPHTRKRFTRSQIGAVLRFAAAEQGDDDEEDEDAAVEAGSADRGHTGERRSPRAVPNPPRSRGHAVSRARRGTSRGQFGG